MSGSSLFWSGLAGGLSSVQATAAALWEDVAQIVAPEPSPGDRSREERDEAERVAAEAADEEARAAAGGAFGARDVRWPRARRRASRRGQGARRRRLF